MLLLVYVKCGCKILTSCPSASNYIDSYTVSHELFKILDTCIVSRC